MITRIFKSGNSQAVRIPKQYRFKNKKAFIRKEKNRIIITPVENQWDELFEELEKLNQKDFLIDRKRPEAQERELF